jgi:alkanesulfonate monooxygenase SsuD/methylene tetrahydromethanopterin reductase-like flavin-dependent oxidoreductase (luciferase family)
LGFEYLWLTEAWGLEALSTAGYLLGITKRIKIGTGVLSTYSRSAALIGMACATLDQIAPGRFILGLGSSGKLVTENWHGASFAKPLQRSREYVEIIRRVARGDNLDHSGDLLRLSGFRLYTKPVTKEQEIYLGAISERNITVAGEISDGVLVTMYPLCKISHALGLLRGSSMEGTKLKLFAYIPMKITQNSEETMSARLEVAKNIAFYVASMGRYYAANLSKLGFEDSVKKILKAYSEGGSRAAADSVDKELVDELALVGSVDRIRERVLSLPHDIVPVFSVDIPRNGISADLRLNLLEPLVRELHDL